MLFSVALRTRVSRCLILAVIFTTLSLVQTASATKYEYWYTSPIPSDCTKAVNGVGLGLGGILTNIASSYDSVTHDFTWTVTFLPCNGKVPEGYIIALNNGPNPKGHAGELAMLYFDATDKHNPVVSAYAYNGKAGYEGRISFKDSYEGNRIPDRIATSKNSNPSWLKEISVTHNAAHDSYTYHLKMDATIIKSHVPAYPDKNDDWWGIGYDNHLGYWFHPVSGLSTSYCGHYDTDDICKKVLPGQTSKNFLKGYWWQHIGWYDTANRKTNTMPFCMGKYKVYQRDGKPLTDSYQDLSNLPTSANGCYSVSAGEKFHAKLMGHDSDHDKLTLTYSGIPDGATASPANGSKGYTPFDATFDWMPQLTDGGEKHTVIYKYTDDHGSEGYCRMKLCVPVDKDPVCKLMITSEGGSTPQCAGFVTTVDFDASGSHDPESDSMTYDWSTTCKTNTGVQEQLSVSADKKKATLELTEPGQGRSSNCSVTVKVKDGYGQQTSCSKNVSVEGCELDCFGQPYGSARLDQCGVCDGNNDCFDCAGVPFGDAQLDQCGVCNGNNDCLDCFGVPFGSAVLDRCGVCDGNGNSCLDCQDTDILPLQFQLDGQGIEQFQTLRYTTVLLRRKGGRKGNRRYIRTVLQQGEELYNQNWVLTWSIPQIITECTNAEFCVQVSNEDNIQGYNLNAEELYSLTRKTIRRMRRQIEERKNSSRRSRFGSKYFQRARDQFSEALALSSNVPPTTSDCS